MAMKFNKLKGAAPDAAATPSKSSLESELIKVTAEIARLDKVEKDAKKKKDALRLQFFQLADQALMFDGLERKVVDLPADFENRFTVASYVERYYPGWVSVERTDDNKLVLEQDPSAQPYTYVNNVDGVVLSRQVSNVKGGIDLDWLCEEYNEIFQAVTKSETIYTLDEERAFLYLNENPASQSVFEQVTYLGTPQAKLAAPKKLKDDE